MANLDLYSKAIENQDICYRFNYICKGNSPSAVGGRSSKSWGCGHVPMSPAGNHQDCSGSAATQTPAQHLSGPQRCEQGSSCLSLTKDVMNSLHDVAGVPPLPLLPHQRARFRRKRPIKWNERKTIQKEHIRKAKQLVKQTLQHTRTKIKEC